MTKEDLLQPEIEKILIDINFIEKYKILWEKYRVEDESYVISNNEIIKTFNNLGYSVSEFDGNQYFSDFFLDNNFNYRLGITVKYNIIHFDISIKNEELGINSGGDFGLLMQLMTNWEIPIKSPCFCNLESFNNLIKDLIDLFEEIKQEMGMRFIPE